MRLSDQRRCIINALCFVGDMRDNLMKTSQIAITRCYVALQCSFVPISPTRGDEGGKVAVIWVQGDTVVSIPAVKDCLVCVAGQEACLVERALCVVGFTCGMPVECLKIHRAAVLTILFGTDDHAVTPCDRLSYWDWFEASLYTAVGSTISFVAAPFVNGSGWCLRQHAGDVHNLPGSRGCPDLEQPENCKMTAPRILMP